MTTQTTINNEKLSPWPWQIEGSTTHFDNAAMSTILKDLSLACYVVNHPEKGLGVSQHAEIASGDSVSSANSQPVSAFAPALGTQSLGNEDFRRCHGVKYAYYAGAMANGISSEELVIALGQAGLSRDAQGEIQIGNKVIAKVSRTEVASKFMLPAPVKMLQALVDEGRITAEQMELAQLVPMADDITAEADSGGHTDNRPLVTLLPTILALKEQIQAQYQFKTPLRVGCGGGVGTPDAALATFNIGAAYIVTGSINQACVEAGASEHTRKLLSTTEMADVTMAPAADMFEMGVKLQVVKRGTLFPMRANKLYELYTRDDSIEAIPVEERLKLEKQVFRSTLDDIWAGTVAHFNERDPKQIERAEGNPKRKMALIFRWYLSLSSRWSNTGEQGREMDYQVWAGPALGAFNAWAKDSYLDDYQQRNAVDLAKHLMHGAAYLARVNLLTSQGIKLDPELARWKPTQRMA